MRYSKDESTYIVGIFNSGDTVSITVYRLPDGTVVVDNQPCTELGTTGIFTYNLSQTVSSKTEYVYVMTNGSYNRYGKIVLGGWMDDIPSDVDTQLTNTHGSGTWTTADISDLALQSTLEQVKVQTDKLQFDTSNNIQARINDKGVLNNPPSENIEDYRADISNLALESTVQSIKAQTDRLQFNTDNDVKATLDGEKVDLVDDLRSAIVFIKEVEGGKWILDTSTNQLILYASDNTTEIARFNLYDENNTPSVTRIYKRERV